MHCCISTTTVRTRTRYNLRYTYIACRLISPLPLLSTRIVRTEPRNSFLLVTKLSHHFNIIFCLFPLHVLSHLALEIETTVLSRNVGHQSASDKEKHPTRMDSVSLRVFPRSVPE